MAGNENTATFALDLDASGLKGPAQDSASALEQLKSKIHADDDAIRGLNQSMRALKAGNLVNSDSYKKLKDQVIAHKASMAQATDVYHKAGGPMTELFKKTKDTSGGLKDATTAVSAFKSPMTELTEMAGGLTAKLGKAGLVGAAVAVVVAFGAVVMAAAAAVYSLAKFGVAAADARRNEELMLEGLVKLPNWYGIAAGSAVYLQESIDRVSGSVPLARDQIAGMATELYQLGFRGAAARKMLDGLAIAQAGGGDKAAARFRAQAEQIRFMGGSLDNLVKKYKNDFGPIVAAKMLSLDVQQQKFKEHLSGLFKGLQIDPLLKALQGVLSIFDTSTASGKALKVILQTVLQPLIDGAAAAGPLVVNFMQDCMIAALELVIVGLKVRNWFQDTFGSDTQDSLDETANNIGLIKGAMIAAAVVVGGLTVAIIGLGVALAVAAIPMMMMVAYSAVGIAAFVAVGAAVGWLGIKIITSIKSAWNWLKSLTWSDIGYGIVRGIMFGLFQLPAMAIGALGDFGEIIWKGGAAAIEALAAIDWLGAGKAVIQGIADGITGGVSWVIDAIKGLARGAIRAFKESLGISSPSKVFAQFGVHTTTGFAGGIEKGSSQVDRALGNMVSLPPIDPNSPEGGPAAAAQGAAAGGAKYTFQFGDINVNGAGAKEQAQDLKDQIATILEGIQIQLGAPA